MNSSANRDLRRALRDIAAERRRLLDAVERLDMAALAAERSGGWSIRRVLQHVIESEYLYAKLLAHQRGESTAALELAPPADAQAATSMLRDTRRAVEALVDGIDDGTLYRLVKVGHEEYSPLSVLENIASHDRDHIEQIEAVLRESRASTTPRVTSQVTIRPATLDDLPAITAIYNHYVIHTPITFDLEPYTAETRRPWFEQFAATGRHRLFVAEDAVRVVAYAGSHQFRTKAAYNTTVETTIYCMPDEHRRGIGAALYGVLFDALASEDIRTAIAGITLPNDASVGLHERFGFKAAGVMHAVGRKFDRYWDVLWMERGVQ
jgi:phosphinothricin acetyltransferase